MQFKIAGADWRLPNTNAKLNLDVRIIAQGVSAVRILIPLILFTGLVAGQTYAPTPAGDTKSGFAQTAFIDSDPHLSALQTRPEFAAIRENIRMNGKPCLTSAEYR